MNATLLRRCGAMDIKQGSGLVLDRNSVDQDLHSKLSNKKHENDFKIQIHKLLISIQSYYKLNVGFSGKFQVI